MSYSPLDEALRRIQDRVKRLEITVARERSTHNIAGVTIDSTAPADDQVLQYDAASGTWVATDPYAAPIGAASGDLAGSYPGPTVAKIQGRDVEDVAPTDGQRLTWVAANARWEPVTPNSAEEILTTQGDLLTIGAWDATDRAAGITPTASSTYWTQSTTYATDSNDATYWGHDSGDALAWIKVDLGATHKIGGVRVLLLTPFDTKRYVLEASPDDSSWATVLTVGDGVNPAPAETLQGIVGTSARYWRLRATVNSGQFNVATWSLYDAAALLRVPVGADGKVLTADSSADAGFGWADPTATPTATEVSYDNSSSGLSATDVQAAIDEVQTEVDGLSGGAVPAGGSTGQVLAKASATDYDTGWADPGGAASAFVGCKLYHNTTQVSANNGTIALAFNAEENDSDGFHDTSTNNSRITVPAGKGGLYLLGATATSSSSVVSQLTFRKSGATDLRGSPILPGSAGGFGIVYSTLVELAEGDYVEAILYTSSSVTIESSGGRSATFWCVRLGA